MLFLNRGNRLLAGRRISKDWHGERMFVSLCNIMNLSPKNYLHRLENLVCIGFDFGGSEVCPVKTPIIRTQVIRITKYPVRWELFREGCGK